ncbi:MAG: TRAP transporter large permease [Deltaproteobacteria bacterium]|nr:MAG: TRAP transporter large permease [Deltaproteobacteria bacterium]
MEISLGLAVAVFGFLVIVSLASGMWIGFALALAGIVGGFVVGVDMKPFIGPTMWQSINSFTLTAVPLFIFMGEVILRSGLSESLYRGIARWMSFVPGKLLHSNIVTCAVIAAVCGTSVATAATVGTVAIPEQEKFGYSRRLVTGSLAAGGTLGILIPPSLMMIVYGAFTGNSVAKLFIGGIIPGFMLAGLYMTYILLACSTDPSLAPPRERLSSAYFGNFVQGFKEIWYVFPLVFIILGSIYLGWATPTEAAAVGAFFSMVISALMRRLNAKVLKEAAFSTVTTTAFVLWLLVGASLLGTGLGMAKIPAKLSALVGSLGIDRYFIWGFVVVFYVLLGMFMDAFAMLVLTVPVTYPVMVKSLGFDPIWYGIVLTILLEMGQITPPVGLNLYVIHGLTKDGKLEDVIRGIAPFFLCQLIMLAVLTLFPTIALWLPGKMFGY